MSCPFGAVISLRAAWPTSHLGARLSPLDRHTAQQFTPDAALLVGSVPAGMSQRLSIPSSHGLIRCLMAPHGN
jgi:hypothetical protein